MRNGRTGRSIHSDESRESSGPVQCVYHLSAVHRVIHRVCPQRAGGPLRRGGGLQSGLHVDHSAELELTNRLAERQALCTMLSERVQPLYLAQPSRWWRILTNTICGTLQHSRLPS